MTRTRTIQRRRAPGAALLAGCGLLAASAASTMPLAHAATGEAATSLVARVAVTQANNVYLIDAQGRRAITTLGTGSRGVSYPTYSWSPDGTYLLLVRDRVDPKTAQPAGSDLLLLDRSGAVLRTLGHPAQYADFAPTWADDGDQIAYLATTPPTVNAPMRTVDAVDVRGVTRVLFSYKVQDGCGGGTADPAEFQQWQQVGYEGRAPAFQWSIAGRRALYSATCAGGINVTNTYTGQTRRLATMTDEATANPADATLVAGTRPAPRDTASQLVLSRLPSGGADTTVVTLGSGELPRWSRDGRTLYFVRRTPGAIYHLRDNYGNRLDLQTYTSAIWRAGSDGTGQRRLLAENAYTFGPLQLSPDGRALIYTRVANDDALWAHRLPGDRIDTTYLSAFQPALSVERLDLVTGAVGTLAAPAARPAVQP